MILCFALGIANVFTIHVGIIVFSAVCLAFSFIILFIEVPLLLRICPTSSTFDAAIRRVSTNWMRAAAYGGMALVQWLSIIAARTSLIAAAVFLSLTGICYLLAAIRGQDFVGSKTLGGAGVAQMIV
ncbi:golgi apparatus membrane protein TVP18 [Sporothrix schenckii ATCC 58251]|uniref:Golgi apparatus membrane protein TVP18 n=2 Tax=Sporothrix schenckii TaxID=29908 RepID=U7PPE8_SPOS1|nr:golgi apparatus membrane protein TVP18 [Sporothrix schenckii ATCC 58251]